MFQSRPRCELDLGLVVRRSLCAVDVTPSSLQDGNGAWLFVFPSCADVYTLKATVTRGNLLTGLVMGSSTDCAPALSPSPFLLWYAST